MTRACLKSWFTGAMLASLIVASASAQAPLRIGSITDGPWNRDQMLLATFQSKIVEAVGDARDVQFPADKQLNADWSTKGSKKALNQLLADSQVDLILTLGLTSSAEVATRKSLGKPVIATRVIAPEILKAPSKKVRNQTVSGVKNLSYITIEGVDLLQRLGAFRQIVPFSRLTFMMLEPLEDLIPKLGARLASDLAPLNLSGANVIFVGDSIGPALADIPPGAEAVVLTPLPQLDSVEYQKLLSTLVDIGLPTFSLGGTTEDVAMGVMAGVTAPHEVEALADRTAANVKSIVAGKDAGELSIGLRVKESFTVNTKVAAALGITFDQGPMADAEETSDEHASEANPSMSAVTQENAESEARIARQVQRLIARQSTYSAFDGINFAVKGNKVILLGHAWRPTTKRGLEKAIGQIEGVELESYVEVLSNSSFDNDIRARVYGSIYAHPVLRRYAPGGGLNSVSVQQAIGDLLRFGLESVQMVRGPHPIHIVVKNGDVALVGVVQSDVDRQVAATQARRVSGVFSVENHLQVARR